MLEQLNSLLRLKFEFVDLERLHHQASRLQIYADEDCTHRLEQLGIATE